MMMIALTQICKPYTVLELESFLSYRLFLTWFCNAVRELSIDKAIIGTVIDTKTFLSRHSTRYKIQILENHHSDWARGLETRIIVTGFIVYLMNVPVVGGLQLTLSSSEAEYVPILNAVGECKFTFNYCKGLELKLIF
jgi:hypothetical protein